ncbi:MAG: class I SAM-dependent methyltransferase [Planctomycetota bacterium]|nr:MAG: class I SAM-dependent methyltransferase [Planctomycetota bacterium]
MGRSSESVAGRDRQREARRHRRRALLRRVAEFQGIRQLQFDRYRQHVRRLYDGPAGAVLIIGSKLSLHEPLVGRLFRTGRFEIRDCRAILDIGSGAGQILGHLLRHAHPEAEIVGCDLSPQMLARARQRLRSRRPKLVAADMTRLPFPDGRFDCVTCGWAMEYLPDPTVGLREIARVLRPGGKLYLLATEDTFAGVMTSRTWHCRTFNRRELRQACESAGLPWRRELWLTRMHELLRMGGILVEACKEAAVGGAPIASETDPEAHAGGRVLPNV